MENYFDFPFISIITVNLNGKDYLKGLLDSLDSITYPADKTEIIVVDNGSTDGSVDYLSESYPAVKLIKNNDNTGFAAANNQGAKAAAGEYLAFLNNDTKVDKKWLTELLRPVYGSVEVVCSGSKVLSIDGKSLDFVGGMLNFEGKGFQVDYGKSADEDVYNRSYYLPFANGGAMLVDRKVFLDAGGFDEDFFSYYEDVDFGWRLWILGYRVVFAPKSIVYHVHHGTSKIFSEDKLRFLKERNALYSVFKNYDDENLAKVFSGTLASIFNRIFTDVKFDYKKYYDFSLEQKSSSSASILMDSEPLSSLMAVKNFFDNLSILKEKRKKIQENRKRDDKAIFTYFKGQFLSVSSDLEYQKKQIDILKTLGIYEVFEKQIKRNLLIISSEVVSKQMAGPAIRVWNLASVLAEHMNVVLAVPNKTNISGQPFKVIQCANESALRELLDKCDVVLCSGMTFSKYKNIKNYERYIIIDMYDPYNLASLVEYGDETIEKQLDVHKSIHLNTNEMLYHGDFYICASERQRDFWLGMLTALNRVNPYSYNQDPVMRKLIDVVSFGLPSNKPIHTRNVIKGVVDGIGKNDFLVLWGGGIYNWFDPLILVKAMKKVSDKRKDIKLFFLGIKHPNPQVKKLALVNETVDLAKKLGIGNKNIFFNFGWVDYDERQNYFLESDAGIITHPEHIETRFAYRTRILDYLWAGLPVISTKGDVLSDMVEKEELGLTVSAGDVDELANAIIQMAEKKSLYDKYKKNIGGVVSRFEWEKVCKPLIDFCLDPVPTAVRNNLKPDQVHLSSDLLEVPANKEHTNNKAKKRGTCYIARRVFYHLFKSGPKKTAIISSNYLKGN